MAQGNVKWFNGDKGYGFIAVEGSKERRPEPQITIGLFTDAAGFALMVEAFEGSRPRRTR